MFAAADRLHDRSTAHESAPKMKSCPTAQTAYQTREMLTQGEALHVNHA